MKIIHAVLFFTKKLLCKISTDEVQTINTQSKRRNIQIRMILTDGFTRATYSSLSDIKTLTFIKESFEKTAQLCSKINLSNLRDSAYIVYTYANGIINSLFRLDRHNNTAPVGLHWYKTYYDNHYTGSNANLQKSSVFKISVYDLNISFSTSITDFCYFPIPP